MILHLHFLLMIPLVVWGECDHPYEQVGATCLYFDTFGNLDFDEAHQLCHSIDGELATVTNATQFKAMIDYIYAIGLTENSYWMDGSDRETEGLWITSKGHNVPMTTPFWLADSSHQEPEGKSGYDCMRLRQSRAFYLDELSCDSHCNALCERSIYYPEVTQDQEEQVIDCPDFYVSIYGKCLSFMNWVDGTWETANQSCIDNNGELAVIDDIEILRSLRLYVLQEGLDDEGYYLGGSDIEEEGIWKWLDGSPVPMGTPFWGIEGSYQEPSGGIDQNCLALPTDGYHYFRDESCTGFYHPLCQYVE